MRFLETVFRHRFVAILPVLIGLVVAVGYQLVQPRSFTSTASLWIDATVPGNSTQNEANQYVDPSTLQESVVQELLSTQSFAIAVGNKGPLAAYLASHPHAEATGLAAVPGLSALFSSSKGSIDDQVAADLPNMVTLVTAGPQVLNITVTAPAPQVAAGTAQAVVDEYSAQAVAAQTASDQVAVKYYQQQVAQSQVTLQNDQTALSNYLKAHPDVPSTGVGDATATELVQAVALDGTTYQNLLSQYQQAQLSLANVASQTGFYELDAPTASGSPVSISKHLLETGLAGLVVGLLVSVLILSFLTATDRSARRAEDIRRSLGLDVVATIGRFTSPTTAVRGGDA
ncbi:MAG: hypothetical protein ABSA40_09885 [Candidatus Dormibacteria bacterium]|jgi:uncharacterized protein involved in exopolysaccharide biosynthesis